MEDGQETPNYRRSNASWMNFGGVTRMRLKRRYALRGSSAPTPRTHKRLAGKHGFGRVCAKCVSWSWSWDIITLCIVRLSP